MKTFYKIMGSFFILVLLVGVIVFFVIANGDFKGTAKALVHGKVPLSLFYSYEGKSSDKSKIVGVIEKVEKDAVYIKVKSGELKKVDLYRNKDFIDSQGIYHSIKLPIIVYIAETEGLEMVKFEDREKRFSILKIGQAVSYNPRGGDIAINKSIYTGR